MRVLLVLLFVQLKVMSQDLTGVWTGELQTTNSSLPYEIVITNDSGKLNGYSLTIFNIEGNENVGIKTIRLKTKGRNIFIEDDKLIYNNYVTTARRVKLFGEMLLKVQDTTITLEGNFRTRSIDLREKNNPSVSGTITLQKLNTPQETKLISTLEEMDLLNSLQLALSSRPAVKMEEAKDVAANSETSKKPSRKTRQSNNDRKDKVTRAADTPAVTKPPAPDPVAAAELATRTTEVIKNVSFKSDSLVIKLYDHGVIDGDTVSVVLNGKVIAGRLGLKGKPTISTIHITPDLGDSLLLVMYAESLGTIPPNTGILIVQEGDIRHEIRFEGTKQKSSAILLTRKRK